MRGFGLVMAATFALAAGRAELPPTEKEPAWFTDFASAQAEARLSGKPIFAVLH
jgi:hypothetical protein